MTVPGAEADTHTALVCAECELVCDSGNFLLGKG